MKVMASAGIKEAYLQLLPQFEAGQACRVQTLWVPTVDMTTRLRGGEAVDLVIMMSNAIDALIAGGQLRAGSRIDLCSSHIGAAVKAGAPIPDLSNPGRFAAAMLAAESIGYSHGPSGVHIGELFERLGLTERVRHKVRHVKGIPVGSLVAAGEAQIGFQQIAELMPVAGIDVLPPLPDELDKVTVFSAGVHVRSAVPELASTLARFLGGAEAAPVMREKGLVPFT
jgi:molybdate transport system substrate-binding protein